MEKRYTRIGARFTTYQQPDDDKILIYELKKKKHITLVLTGK